MSCSPIISQGCYPEGATSFHDYSFKDKKGDPVTVAESVKYKLYDGIEVLIDWTVISPPTAPGEIEVDWEKNIILNSNQRYLTIIAFHNGGERIQQTILYELQNSQNIDESSP